MAMIEGFRIQNYRALKDIAMGRIGTDTELRKAKPLTPMKTVIGKNGVGKSSIFDAFGFLADCMHTDMERLADDIYPGGLNALGRHGKRSVRILEQKRVWAKEICPHMDVENNPSPSFQCFCDGIRRMLVAQL